MGGFDEVKCSVVLYRMNRISWLWYSPVHASFRQTRALYLNCGSNLAGVTWSFSKIKHLL